MPEAKLDVEVPEEVWIGDLSRQYPETTFRILAALPGDNGGVGLTEIEGQSGTIIEEMRDYDDIRDVQVLTEMDDHTLVQFETTLPLLLLPARDAHAPLKTPFELSDGSVAWVVTAPSETLSDLYSQLDYFDISYSIEYVHYGIEHKQLLTDVQQNLIEQAVDMGYYETPRQCSLTDVAEQTGRSKSTASGILHRAESRIIKNHVGVETPQQC